MPHRILLFRASIEADPFERVMGDAGWLPACVPVLEFEPIHEDQLIERLGHAEAYAGVICTSPRASRLLADALNENKELGKAWKGVRAYVTGERTAAPLSAAGLETFGMHSGGAAELARCIEADFSALMDRPLLLLSGTSRRDELPQALRRLGLPFVEQHIYESRVRADLDLAGHEEPAWVVFFSPKGVDAIYSIWPSSWDRVKKAAIGETTAGAIRSAGWKVDAVASTPTPEGLLEALLSVRFDVRFDVRCSKLLDHEGFRYEFFYGGRMLTFGDVLEAWQSDAGFRSIFIHALNEAPFAAYRWETPAVSIDTLDKPFECVLIDAPELAGAPDRYSFASYFDQASDVAAFENLGKDALLIAPVPTGPGADFGHLAAFSRHATDAQNHALWKKVGEKARERLQRERIWISTAGDGVAWLHIRLDRRPKYYRYRAYVR